MYTQHACRGVADGDDSQGSEGDDENVEDGNALQPALNGGTGLLGSHPEAQSSSDADGEEEEDDSEEEEEAAGNGEQEAQAVGEQQEEKENTV